MPRQACSALVRRPEVAAALQRLGTAAIAGDLLQPQSLAVALEGCDAVVHLAHGDRGPQATQNLIKVAAQAGVRRFIHISSMAVHGPAPGPDAVHENTAQIGRYGNDYCDSKAEQEELVWAAHARGDIAAIVLRPTIVYGPGSHFVTQVVDQARRGEVSFVDSGTGVCNAVYVDDVCDAIDAALEHPEAAGEAFFINGERAIQWRQFIEAFAWDDGASIRYVNISSKEAAQYWAAHPSPLPAGFAVRAWRKFGKLLKPPALPPFPMLGRVERETLCVAFSSEKAGRLLGWAPRVGFEEGAQLTRAWLSAGGYPR